MLARVGVIAKIIRGRGGENHFYNTQEKKRKRTGGGKKGVDLPPLLGGENYSRDKGRAFYTDDSEKLGRHESCKNDSRRTVCTGGNNDQQGRNGGGRCSVMEGIEFGSP